MKKILPCSVHTVFLACTESGAPGPRAAGSKLESARGWKDDPDTLRILKDRAVNDATPEADWEDWQGGVRNIALQNIVRGWHDDSETLTLLREREKNDPTPWLRKKAKQMADKLEARGMTPPLPGVKP